MEVPANQRDEEGNPLSVKARLFFDNPIFEACSKSKDEGFDEMEGLFDDEIVMKHSKKDKKNKKSTSLVASDDEDKKGFEVVPIQADPVVESSDDDSPIIDTAEAYTMAQKIRTKSGKRDLIDDSFNRYTFNDTNLPSW